MTKHGSNLLTISIIAYILAIIALGMFVFSIFLSNNSTLQSQGLYWFGLSAVCAILPTVFPLVTKLKVMDFEVELRQKLEDVEKRVDEIEDAFIKSFESIKRKEQEVPPSLIEARNRHWDRFYENMKRLGPTQRFEVQKLNSLDYLEQFGLTVKELKDRLTKLGFYKGKVDNVFSEDLAQSIENFQRSNNMRHIDGIFGELTLEKMSQKLLDLSKQGKY